MKVNIKVKQKDGTLCDSYTPPPILKVNKTRKEGGKEQVK